MNIVVFDLCNSLFSLSKTFGFAVLYAFFSLSKMSSLDVLNVQSLQSHPISSLTSPLYVYTQFFEFMPNLYPVFPLTVYVQFVENIPVIFSVFPLTVYVQFVE